MSTPLRWIGADPHDQTMRSVRGERGAVHQEGGIIVRKAIRDFKTLSPVRQAAIVAIAAWQLWLLAAAQRDIHRRPADQVRGRKALWRVICLLNTVGPLAYFRWGRRDGATATRQATSSKRGAGAR